jgi:hypothetical protein
MACLLAPELMPIRAASIRTDAATERRRPGGRHCAPIGASGSLAATTEGARNDRYGAPGGNRRSTAVGTLGEVGVEGADGTRSPNVCTAVGAGGAPQLPSASQL